MGVQVDAAAGGGGFTEQQGGARRRVDLGPVMHFDDFDVEAFVQRLRDALDQRGEQVDAEADIA